MKPPLFALGVLGFSLLVAGQGSAQTQEPQSGTPPAAAPTGTGQATPTQPSVAVANRAPQNLPGWARVSFFANGSSSSVTDGGRDTFSEMVTSLAVQAPVREGGGFDYGIDARFAAYPSSVERLNRVSIYNAFAGFQTDGRRFGVKVGQVWLNDLGALGALGGGVVELRRPMGTGGHVRFGGFAGLEPKILQAGYVDGIRKAGGYIVFEGEGTLRRQTVGYVHVRNGEFAERSVLTFSNYLPIKRKNIFVYQAAEYDLAGPAGLGSGGLSYFFTNARGDVVRRVELQATYHRGRSVDARAITLDQLNGRPISSKSLDGFLFESAGGRVTVQVHKTVRVFGGYAVDRNNAGDPSNGRLQVGVWAANLAQTGIDVNVSDSRIITEGRTRFDSWYLSVGRSIVSRVYLTGEFSSSLSLLRFTSTTEPTGGFTLENRPRTRRYAVSATARVYRPASILITFERLEDPSFTEQRVLSGLTYRF